MLRHIVMWKFRPGTETERELFLTGLQGLYGEIPELKRCEVLRGTERSDYDAVLISEFADQAALERYKADPRHQAVSALCKSIRTDRAAVDCPLPEQSIQFAVPQAGGEIHPAVRGEGNALCFQQGALGAGGVDVEAAFGTAEAVYHPVAGNRRILTGGHGVANDPCTAGHPRQTGDLTVGGHLSGGDSPGDIVKSTENITAHGKTSCLKMRFRI